MTRNMDIARRVFGSGNLASAIALTEPADVIKLTPRSRAIARNAAHFTKTTVQCGQSVGFALQSRRKLNLKGGVQQKDAVYTALPTLPEGAVKIYALGAVTAPLAKRTFDAVRTYG